MTKQQIILPDAVRQIIETLQKAGFEAYAVGGCIRDSVLGRTPADWDVTTSATPVQVKALFRRTIDTGLQHGTVTVLAGKERFEVTTYRIDGIYEDGRHPKEVTFTASLEEDLARRDFTINAMAYNDKAGLQDLFGGMDDLEKGIIRCVGDPRQRFSEDSLRIMRAVRFAAQLGYSIEPDTRAAMCELSGTLERISAERVRDELVKLLCSPHPEEMRTAYEVGITACVLPEFDVCMKTEQNNPHHCYNVGEHILHTLAFAEPNRVMRLTMLLHDIGKPATRTVDENGITHNHGHAQLGAEMAGEILRRLRFDNDTTEQVVHLIRYHDEKFPAEPKPVRRAMNRIGVAYFPAWLDVKYADLMGQSDYKREEKQQNLRDIRRVYEEILREKDCVTLKDLAVSGADLIAWGMQPGREIGETLQRMLDIVLEEPERNDKEYLLSLLPFPENAAEDQDKDQQ